MLEDELDCKLIERGRGQNQSRLTKEGEAFLPLAERLKDVRYDIKSFKEISCHPSITVGCVESMGIYLWMNSTTAWLNVATRLKCTLF
ncbi:MAG: hypothetical protein ACLTW9_26235 [Enterocloster sp.]